MAFILATLLTSPHQQMHPVVISKTGLGLWESVADVRHLPPLLRVKFACSLHHALYPEVDESTDYGKSVMDDYVKTSARRTKALVHDGRLIEDFYFFDTHREQITKCARAQGLSLLYVGDN